MPTGKLLYGNRDYVYDREFYKEKLVEKNKVTLSYFKCKEIIMACNKNIAELTINEIDGFKLPNGLGYLVPSKFKMRKAAINWQKTKEIKKYVYFLNLHTRGFSCRIEWFRVGRKHGKRINELFKFVTYKTLRKAISDNFINGKSYKEWVRKDFVEISRLENLYNKKYRKELKE